MSLLLVKPVADHLVITVTLVTHVTVMSNCDWTKEQKSLLKANKIIKLSLSLSHYFLISLVHFLVDMGDGERGGVPVCIPG